MTDQRKPTGAYSVAMLAERWGTSDTFVYDQIKAGNGRALSQAREDAALYERIQNAKAETARLIKVGDKLTAELNKALAAEAKAVVANFEAGNRNFDVARVTPALLAAGADAWSCDLKPTEAPGPHIQGDALKVLLWGWDLMICHPECRYLSSSGLFRNIDNPERQQKTEEAVAFAMALWDAPIPFIAMENPVGRLGTTIGRAQQMVQPYEFGHDASKRTCLWLKGLPPLSINPADRVAGRLVAKIGGKWAAYAGVGKAVERWANQTDSGQNRLPPSEDRSAKRAATYSNIAAAMARDWLPAIAGQLRLAA